MEQNTPQLTGNPQVDPQQPIVNTPPTPPSPDGSQQEATSNPDHEAVLFLATQVLGIKKELEGKINDLEKQLQDMTQSHGDLQGGLKDTVKKVVDSELAGIKKEIKDIING